MPPPERHTFHVAADPAPDVLLRILGPFAVQGAALAAVRHEQAQEGAWTVLEVTGLDGARADLLALRLEQIPSVREVRIRTALALVGSAAK